MIPEGPDPLTLLRTLRSGPAEAAMAQAFAWGAAVLAVGSAGADDDPIVDYHVEVRDRPDMGLTVAQDLERLTFSGKPEGHVPEGWLIPGKRYYWRVRAKDKRGAWSPWSDTWSFVAGPPARESAR